ncbi:hypothetical protein [Rhodococcus opacus]|uniref:hypothetical protein n=1 Tax=Rhodococcus opacus TaxID=37919 RepID=UPI0024BABB20|nr:hypothetical protein [Rhodococcus opacus]MDJ0418842.1 hypothetical protein [Rhodococcus opacus]
MLIVAMLALGVAFLSGALYPLRGVVRSWSDGDRSKNQSTVAAMSLVALYGLLFLYSGVTGLFGARLSATTILAFFGITVLVGTGFAVASLYSKRRAWSLDNELRAASGRPDRRHWMPPLLVGLVWLMGGSIAQVGVLLLVASLSVGERSPETTTDDLGATVAIVVMAAVMVIAAGAAGTQKWRMDREEHRLQVSDRAMAQRGHGGGRG